MSTFLRTSFGAHVAAGFFLLTGLQAQDLSELATATRDLRITLRDLDKRLSTLETLVKQQAREGKKQRSSKGTSAPTIRIDLAANLIAGQDAYRRGGLEESGHQYERAIELYTKAIGLDPGNELALLHRGASNLQIGRLDEALSDVNQSVAIQPNNAQAYAFRARVYAATKSFALALADFQEASQRDPGNVEYLLSQAAVEEQLGNFKRAAEIYELASKIKPDAAEIYVKRASALRQIDQGSLAAEQCSVAIRLKPTGAEGYACRSESYVRLGLLSQAVSDLNQAVRLEPTLPQVTSLLSVVRDTLAVNEALEKLSTTRNSKVAEVSPAPVQTGRDAPVSIARPSAEPVAPVPVKAPLAKNPETTVLDPADSRRLVREGRRNMEKGLFQSALTNLNKAIELDPSSALAYNTRGYAYLRTRQFDLAIRDFSKAIDLNSAYANAYWNRGAARRIGGDERGGREDMAKAGQLGYRLPAAPSAP